MAPKLTYGRIPGYLLGYSKTNNPQGKYNCQLNLEDELIDHDTCTWNRDLITQHLSVDVPTILSIPL
jgi:hypothetical protein